MTDDLIGDVSRREQIEALLAENLPLYCREGTKILDLPKLRKALGLTRQGMNYWFTRENISHRKLKELTELEGSTLTIEMLFPFSVLD